METSRHKEIVTLSSDHAGVNQALGWLERELLRALARIDDPRKVRDYLLHLKIESALWCDENAVDGRGWQERLARKRG